MTVTVLLAGSLFGAGIAAALRAIRHMRPAAATSATLTAAFAGSAPGRPLPEVVRERALGLFGAVGLDPRRRLAADLAITERSAEAHCVRSLAAALWFASLGTAAVAAFDAAGLGVPPVALVGVAGLGLIGGIAVAEFVLRQEAANRREEFRQDLSAFCELMVLLLAAGAGVESSLTGAAAAGDDWTWQRIRSALRESQRTGQPVADALVRVGSQLGVVELEELGTAVALAATSGGRLRASLAARSEALRLRELARQQAEGARASERMTFPVVALAVGYLLILAYPALSKILSGFH